MQKDTVAEPRSISMIADAMNFWERKRIVYNVVLAILVVLVWGGDIWDSRSGEMLGALMVLFVLAGIANILYCLAYPVDLIMQVMTKPFQWRSYRWILFVTGVLIASVSALWIMLRRGMG